MRPAFRVEGEPAEPPGWPLNPRTDPDGRAAAVRRNNNNKAGRVSRRNTGGVCLPPPAPNSSTTQPQRLRHQPQDSCRAARLPQRVHGDEPAERLRPRSNVRADILRHIFTVHYDLWPCLSRYIILFTILCSFFIFLLWGLFVVGTARADSICVTQVCLGFIEKRYTNKMYHDS